MRGVLIGSAVGVGAMAAGCAAGDPRDPPATVVRDSAGIAVVESAAAAAARPVPWSLDDRPDVAIGVAEGAPEYQLSRVRGAARLDDGRIVVVNGGSQEIRFYDAGGRFLNAVGRSGEGPGEYRLPVLVHAPAYDSLLIYDFGARFTMLAADGSLGRIVTPTAFPGNIIGRTDGRLLMSRSSAAMGLDTPEGVQPNTMTFSSYDLETGELQTIVELAGQRVFGWREGNRVGFTAVPYDASPSAAVGARGIYIAPGAAAEVRLHSGDGTLLRIARVDQPPRPLPRAEYDRYVDERIATASEAQRPVVRRAYGRMSAPETLPAFHSLAVDALDYVWARVHDIESPDAPMRWTVFDPEGRALGYIETPPGLRIEQIGEDFVLGVVRDELDVERVVRYGLER